MELILDILKIVAYIGGGFLIAFRVANYYIKRDTQLKSENAYMKEKIDDLTEKLDVILDQTSENKVLVNRVTQLEEANRELKQNHKSLMDNVNRIFKELTEIKISLERKVNRV